MLNLQEIDEAIAELEHQRNHSTGDCAVLASLYSIRDHAFQDRDQAQPATVQYSTLPATSFSAYAETYGDSDFLLAISGKDMQRVFEIVDDLMDTLSVTYPRVYDSIMRKIGNL